MKKRTKKLAPLSHIDRMFSLVHLLAKKKRNGSK